MYLMMEPTQTNNDVNAESDLDMGMIARLEEARQYVMELIRRVANLREDICTYVCTGNSFSRPLQAFGDLPNSTNNASSSLNNPLPGPSNEYSLSIHSNQISRAQKMAAKSTPANTQIQQYIDELVSPITAASERLIERNDNDQSPQEMSPETQTLINLIERLSHLSTTIQETTPPKKNVHYLPQDQHGLVTPDISIEMLAYIGQIAPSQNISENTLSTVPKPKEDIDGLVSLVNNTRKTTSAASSAQSHQSASNSLTNPLPGSSKEESLSIHNNHISRAQKIAANSTPTNLQTKQEIDVLAPLLNHSRNTKSTASPGQSHPSSKRTHKQPITAVSERPIERNDIDQDPQGMPPEIQFLVSLLKRQSNSSLTIRKSTPPEHTSNAQKMAAKSPPTNIQIKQEIDVLAPLLSDAKKTISAASSGQPHQSLKRPHQQRINVVPEKKLRDGCSKQALVPKKPIQRNGNAQSTPKNSGTNSVITSSIGLRIPDDPEQNYLSPATRFYQKYKQLPVPKKTTSGKPAVLRYVSLNNKTPPYVQHFPCINNQLVQSPKVSNEFQSSESLQKPARQVTYQPLAGESTAGDHLNQTPGIQDTMQKRPSAAPNSQTSTNQPLQISGNSYQNQLQSVFKAYTQDPSTISLFQGKATEISSNDQRPPPQSTTENVPSATQTVPTLTNQSNQSLDQSYKNQFEVDCLGVALPTMRAQQKFDRESVVTDGINQKVNSHNILHNVPVVVKKTSRSATHSCSSGNCSYDSQFSSVTPKDSSQDLRIQDQLILKSVETKFGSQNIDPESSIERKLPAEPTVPSSLDSIQSLVAYLRAIPDFDKIIKEMIAVCESKMEKPQSDDDDVMVIPD